MKFKKLKKPIEITDDFIYALKEEYIKLADILMDKEDIESCGFVFAGSENSEVMWFRNKQDWKLAFSRSAIKIFDEFHLPIFKGKLKISRSSNV